MPSMQNSKKFDSHWNVTSLHLAELTVTAENNPKLSRREETQERGRQSV